ncbi:Radical SAM domain protein [Vulcanisaeta moutnovskia 768-28]|uniref:Radical SAM domain protein n=1 Tax=Vulcanisaeta moutnovskia (strain 768-28) TaxID=985053 RepID=F0QSV8_VULM7|nr:radical SAM protein [Vulcanisaeta moutnovskia]ADY00379.1 Radical SAM domain protein [Vulcanisaeta moutnovskia 768-28]
MDLIKRLEFKEKLRNKLENELSPESIERARKDPHARRYPRPCGMTIHTGIGCAYSCTYCYIYNMGFPHKAQPYPLSGKELLYALTLNPYVVLGPGGTMFAMGSVTEPFLPETRDRALEYIEVLGSLGNPLQVSSKSVLNDEYITKIKEYAPHISFLETVVCIRDCRKIEPLAPDPMNRLEFMGRLVKAGINVGLFMRPIIPGITDRDAKEILELAREVGVKTVVLGTLRITKNIYTRLRSIGINLDDRLPTSRLGREQVPIRARDLKDWIAGKAREMGFRVYEAACGANIEAAGLGCWACRWGPCGDLSKLPNVDARDVNEFLKYLGYSGSVEQLGDRRIVVRLDSGDGRRVEALLRELLRREVIIKGRSRPHCASTSACGDYD